MRDWIEPATRLMIYLRDGMACVYCGRTVEGGVALELDHLLPPAQGGNHAVRNLVTTCHQCTTARQGRQLGAWCRQVAAAYDLSTEDVYRHVCICAGRPLPKTGVTELRAARNPQ